MSNARNLANLLGTDTQITTADIADGVFQANRNLIINGAMQVAQRGTSQTGITSGGYKEAPDRHNFNVVTAGTWTVSQSTTAPEGFSNSYKVECTTADASLAASDVVRLRQRIEGQNLQQLKKGTSNAESVTLSFYVRSSKTGTYIVQLKDKDNNRHIAKSYNITSANTWQYVSITYDGDTTGSLDNDNAESLSLHFFLAAGSNFTSGTLDTSWATTTTANSAVGQVNLADAVGNEWYITGIQLEVGDTATPFEHRSFGDELAKCQRYFCKSYNYDIAPGASASTNNLKGAVSVSGGTSTSNRPFWSAGQYPVTMRSEPTIVLYHYDGTSGKITGGSFASYNGSAVNIGDRGFNLHPTGNVSNSNDEDHYAIFTASAEL
jgi:hypothetical protein